MEKQELKVGSVVVYVDPKGNPQNALVTAVWNPNCINVVLVSQDESKTDGYGRQIERMTSLAHKDLTQVHGCYFALPGEELNEYKPPQSV